MMKTVMTLVLSLVLLLLSSTCTTSANNFVKLINSHQGQSPPGLASVKLYLNTFGYLPTNSNSTTTFDDKFDDAFHSALLLYQEFFHLNKTGILDLATVELMAMPRCGNPDIFIQKTTATNGRDLFATFANKWPVGSVLGYYLVSPGNKAVQRRIGTIFKQAFTTWSTQANISFRRVYTKDQASITIGFYKGNHGDGYPFDGTGGIKNRLAHAFPPRDGRIHFDLAEHWALTLDYLKATPKSHDLYTVAVHEIGHAIGLRHSQYKKAVMYSRISKQQRKQLYSDDIQGIRYLYP